MKYAVLLFGSFCVMLISCIRNANPEKPEVSNKEFADTSGMAIIPVDSASIQLPDSRPAELSSIELQTLDSLLTLFIADENGRYAKDSLGHQKIDVVKYQYKKQLVPFITSNDEKKVWVNCFCSDHFVDWRREIVLVEDGGACYFNLIINLTDRSYSNFYINGEA